mgnify:CR=1 FL=1
MSKKVLKKAAIGTAIGTAALVGAVIPVSYELILNIPFASKIGEKFSPATIESPEEEKPAPVVTEGPTEQERFGAAVGEWHSRHSAEDLFILNDKGIKRHAKVFDNGHNDKWAIHLKSLRYVPLCILLCRNGLQLSSSLYDRPRR